MEFKIHSSKKNKFLFPGIEVVRSDLKFEIAEFEQETSEATEANSGLQYLIKMNKSSSNNATPDNTQKKEKDNCTAVHNKEIEQNQQSTSTNVEVPPQESFRDNSTSNINNMDEDIKTQIINIIATYNLGKKEAILIALNMIRRYLETTKYIKRAEVNGTVAYVVNVPYGFEELNAYTGVLDIFNNEDTMESHKRLIKSFVDCLRDTSNLVSFDTKCGGRTLTQVPWEGWLKAVFVYQDSVNDAFNIKIKNKI